MNHPHLLIKTNLIKILHHHPRSKLAQAPPIFTRGTPAPFSSRRRKLVGIVIDFGLEFEQFGTGLFFGELRRFEEDVGGGGLFAPVGVHGLDCVPYGHLVGGGRTDIVGWGVGGEGGRGGDCVEEEEGDDETVHG